MMPPQAPSFIESTEDMWIGEDAGPGDTIMETESVGKSSSVPDVISTGKILDAMGTKPELAVGDEISRKQFNRMLLDHVSPFPFATSFETDFAMQCDDFVHVLSLKGSLLYVSPSSSQLLEYEPSELVGNPLSSFCHPSDIVSVLRELKEAGSISQPIISLLYRIRRKDSGYMWLEASGKLHCSFFLFTSRLRLTNFLQSSTERVANASSSSDGRERSTICRGVRSIASVGWGVRNIGHSSTGRSSAWTVCSSTPRTTSSEFSASLPRNWVSLFLVHYSAFADSFRQSER